MPLLYQLLLRFTIGYHNLNFRDIADIGHARLLLEASDTSLREEWGHRVRQGEMLALAVTEPTGGTNVMHTMQTTATVTELCYFEWHQVLDQQTSGIERFSSVAQRYSYRQNRPALVPASTPGMG
jgi:hypothetical protein